MNKREEPAPTVCQRRGIAIELLEKGNVLYLWDKTPVDVEHRAYSHVCDTYALYSHPQGFLLEFIESHEASNTSYRAIVLSKRPDKDRIGKEFLKCLTGRSYLCALMGDSDALG